LVQTNGLFHRGIKKNTLEDRRLSAMEKVLGDNKRRTSYLGLKGLSDESRTRKKTENQKRRTLMKGRITIKESPYESYKKGKLKKAGSLRKKEASWEEEGEERMIKTNNMTKIRGIARIEK